MRTTSGPSEIVLDVPNLCLDIRGLRIEDLDDPLISGLIDGLARDEIPYNKLTVYAWPEKELSWVARGFLKEGLILGFFPAGHDSHIWTLYGDEQRNFALRDAAHDRIVLMAGETDQEQPAPPADVSHGIAGPEDSAAIAEFVAANTTGGNRSFDAAVIGNAIEKGLARYHMMANGKDRLLAVASAEVGNRGPAAALDVFAPRSDRDCWEMVSYLVLELGRDLNSTCGIPHLHAFVRADDIGMNRVFVRLGYIYAGRLVNHNLIPGGWESLNIWCLPSQAAVRLSTEKP